MFARSPMLVVDLLKKYSGKKIRCHHNQASILMCVLGVLQKAAILIGGECRQAKFDKLWVVISLFLKDPRL